MNFIHKAAVIAVTVLAVAMGFMLVACGPAQLAGDVPAKPSSSADASAEVTPSAADTSEYALVDKSGSGKIQVGAQSGEYPWGLSFNVSDVTSHTSGEAPGTTFYRIDAEQYRLFYQHIDKTGKDVISRFMTASRFYETEKGLAVGDTIDTLLDTYNKNLLYQPEPDPISQDYGGDFCVYDALYIYTRPEDDNCSIVFYVASLAAGKIITGIDISLGQDGSPAFAADNVGTFAVDYAAPAKYLKTDTSAEDKVHALFQTKSDTKALLEALPDFNWRIYDQSYKDEAMDLLDWLSQQNITSEHDILCVLKSTKGLDGAYSEGYSNILSRIYLSITDKFIRSASQLGDAKIDALAQMLHYGLSDKKDQVLSGLIMLLDTGGLSEKEQRVIMAIQHYFVR
jgi:hypothetical protein